LAQGWNVKQPKWGRRKKDKKRRKTEEKKHIKKKLQPKLRRGGVKPEG